MLEVLGKPPRGSDRCAEGIPMALAMRHVGWLWSPGLGWPETSTASTAAATGVWVGAGLALRLTNEPAVALALLYGALRVERTHVRGHLVTGASPAMSPCGGSYDEQRGDIYGE